MTNQRVLVVEDEHLIRSIIVETLADAGFEVDEAISADAAAKMLEADGYYLLVTDVHMPGELDGIDLAKLAYSRQPEVPVVIATVRPNTIKRLEATGVRGAALPTPFSLSELVTVVSRYARAAPNSLGSRATRQQSVNGGDGHGCANWNGDASRDTETD